VQNLTILALSVPEISQVPPKFKVGHVTMTMSHMLGLDIACCIVHTKFDACSFSHSRDMVGAHHNLNDSRGLTTPLSGLIYRLWVGLAMINLLPNLKFVSPPTVRI